jgi:hypothetical protein
MDKGGLHWFLFRLIGRRIAVQFGLLSFVFAATLAALYLASGYALQSYASDQIGRIPWDISAGQREAVRSYPKVQHVLRRVPGVRRVEALGLLRVINVGDPIRVELDGKALPVRWMAVVSASDPQLLPEQLRSSDGALSSVLLDAPMPDRGPPLYHAGLLALRKVGNGSLVGSGHDHGDHDHAEDSGASYSVLSSSPEFLFRSLIRQPVSLERDAFNKWLLRNVGSVSYLPGQSIVVAVPMDRFAELATLFDRSFGASVGMHGGSAAPPYIPEVTHLVRLDREKWIEPWLFTPNLRRLAILQDDVLRTIQRFSIFSYASSDSFVVMNRMSQISRMVGVVTLLLALPLLWLAWAVSGMLGRLFFIHERRLIGLALIRGIPLQTVRCTLVGSAVGGCVAGGAAGLLAGISLTVAGYALGGAPSPPLSVFLSGSVFYLLFALVGTGITALSALLAIRRIGSISPREAIAHVPHDEGIDATRSAGRLQLTLSMAALLVGMVKLAEWIGDRSLLPDGAPETAGVAILQLLNGVLNFLAIPLLLLGIAGLLGSRLSGVRSVLAAMTAPIAGRLQWFVGAHMAVHRQRVAVTLFIASLAMAAALLPQVAADSFYDRILRGVETSIGGDVQIEYDLPRLTGHAGATTATFEQARDAAAAPLRSVEGAIRARIPGSRTTAIYEMIASGIYVPNQSGLVFDILRSPDEYLDTVHREESLGISRKFTDIISEADKGHLAASSGLLRLRRVPLGQPVIMGYANGHGVTAQFRDVFGFLPGQPTLNVAQREGYAPAEVDYLNYMLTVDARTVSTAAAFSRAPLNRLGMRPSRMVIIVRMPEGTLTTDATVEALVRALPIKPQAVRWQAQERQRLSRDMFMSLALANLRVFVIGGLILTLSGIVVIGMANFQAERRTFALLAVRGLPVRTLIRISLSIFMAPVAIGLLVGVILGLVAGYGLSEAVWRLPRIYGVAGLLQGTPILSPTAMTIIAGFSVTLLIAAILFALAPFRGAANDNFRKS